MKKGSFFRVVGSVSGLVILTKFLGFVKQMVTANAFGATIQTDLISISEALISNFDYVLIQVIATAMIPIYFRAKIEGEEKKIVSDITKIFLILSSLAISCLILFSPWIARVLAPSYSEKMSAELARYIRVLAPILLFYVLLAIFRSILNANEKFVPGQLIGFNGSMIIIFLVMFFSKKVGPEILVLGMWLSAAVNVIILGMQSRKYWCIRKGNPLKNKFVHEFLRMILPLCLSYAMVFINQQVDKILVSGMEEGTVTAMGYGNTISQLVVVLIASICTIMFTKLSVSVSEKNYQATADVMTKFLRVMISGLIPITVLTICFSNEIVSIVFGRGAFDEIAVGRASRALIGYSFSFIPYAINSMAARVLHSYMNTKATTINSSIGITLNIVLSLLLYKEYGIFGVTFASSMAELLCACLNLIAAKKVNRHIRISVFCKQLLLWVCGGVACTFFAIKCKKVWFAECTNLLKFVISTIVCGGIYLICVSPLIMKWIKRKSKV